MTIGGDVGGPILALVTGLDFGAVTLPPPAVHLGLGTLKRKAVLHVDGDRAAERVQAEHRVAVDQIHAADRRLGYEIPLDGVAERFVDADAILEHRDALGFAEQGRGGEAAVAHVLLVGIVLHVDDGDAAELTVDKIGQGPRWMAVEIFLGNRLRIARNLISRYAGAEQWGSAENFDIGENLDGVILRHRRRPK